MGDAEGSARRDVQLAARPAVGGEVSTDPAAGTPRRYRLLADHGLIDSVSVAATRALEDGLQALIVGMRLDAIYAEHPEVRPTEGEIEAMAVRGGLARG